MKLLSADGRSRRGREPHGVSIHSTLLGGPALERLLGIVPRLVRLGRRARSRRCAAQIRLILAGLRRFSHECVAIYGTE